MKFTSAPLQKAVASSAQPLWKQFLLGCLPIIGTGCLMCWLSGGFYPRTWQLFVQACVQFSRLRAQQGTAFLFPFALLAGQALLLALAWGGLLWLAVRAGFRLFSVWQARNASVRIALPSEAGRPGTMLHASTPVSPLQNNPSPAPPLMSGPRTIPQQNKPLLPRPAVAPPRTPTSDVSTWSIAAPTVISQTDLMLDNPFEEAKSPVEGLDNPFEKAESSPLFPPAVPPRVLPQTRVTSLNKDISRHAAIAQDVSQRDLFAESEPAVGQGELNQAEQLPPPEMTMPLQSNYNHADENAGDQPRGRAFKRSVSILPPPGEYDKKNDGGYVVAIVKQDVSTNQPQSVEEQDQQKEVVRESEDEQEQTQLSSVLHELGFFHQKQLDERNQRAVSEPEKKASLLEPPSGSVNAPLSVNPFEVQSEVLNLFSSPDAPDQKSESKEAPQKPASPRKQTPSSPINPNMDQVYTLGNPFEGALPEVFEHDEDLKHAVLTQVSEELEQRTKRKRRTRGQTPPFNEKKMEK